MRERIARREYSGTTAVATDRVTHFVGNAEVVRFASGKIEVRRYLSGVLRVRTKESGRDWERRDFLYTDHLGSTHVIADDDGMPLYAFADDRAHGEEAPLREEAASPLRLLGALPDLLAELYRHHLSWRRVAWFGWF